MLFYRVRNPEFVQMRLSAIKHALHRVVEDGCGDYFVFCNHTNGRSNDFEILFNKLDSENVVVKFDTTIQSLLQKLEEIEKEEVLEYALLFVNNLQHRMEQCHIIDTHQKSITFIIARADGVAV